MKFLIGIQTMLLLLAAAADDADSAAVREHPAAVSPCDRAPDAPAGADCSEVLGAR